MKRDEDDMTHDYENIKRGAVIQSKGKTRITMYLDDDVLKYFRELATSKGRGYQTEINTCLRYAMTGEVQWKDKFEVNVVSIDMVSLPHLRGWESARLYREIALLPDPTSADMAFGKSDRLMTRKRTLPGAA